MNTITENVLSAIDTISQANNKNLRYDKTVLAKIVEVRSIEKGEYIVEYQSGKFQAWATPGTAYEKDEEVLVKIPEGDMSNKKIIEGTSEAYLDQLESIKRRLNIYSYNLAQDLDKKDKIGLIADIAAANSVTLEDDRDIILTLNSTNFKNYMKNHSCLMIGVDITTQFKYPIGSGNYGLKITLYPAGTEAEENAITKYLDTNNFTGSIYDFSTSAHQEMLFEFIPGDYDKLTIGFFENLKYKDYSSIVDIDQISVKNIFFENFEIYLTSSLNDLPTYVINPEIKFTETKEGDEVVAKFAEITPVLYYGGKVIDDENITWSWQRLNSSWTKLDLSSKVLTVEYDKDTDWSCAYFKAVAQLEGEEYKSEEITIFNDFYAWEFYVTEDSIINSLTLNKNYLSKSEEEPELDLSVRWEFKEDPSITGNTITWQIPDRVFHNYQSRNFICYVYSNSQLITKLDYLFWATINLNRPFSIPVEGTDWFYYDTYGALAANQDQFELKIPRYVNQMENGIEVYRIISNLKWYWKGVQALENQSLSDLNLSDSMLCSIDGITENDDYFKIAFTVNKKFTQEKSFNNYFLINCLSNGEPYTQKIPLNFIINGQTGTNGTGWYATIEGNGILSLANKDINNCLEFNLEVYKGGELSGDYVIKNVTVIPEGEAPKGENDKPLATNKLAAADAINCNVFWHKEANKSNSSLFVNLMGYEEVKESPIELLSTKYNQTLEDNLRKKIKEKLPNIGNSTLNTLIALMSREEFITYLTNRGVDEGLAIEYYEEREVIFNDNDPADTTSASENEKRYNQVKTVIENLLIESNNINTQTNTYSLELEYANRIYSLLYKRQEEFRQDFIDGAGLTTKKDKKIWEQLLSHGPVFGGGKKYSTIKELLQEDYKIPRKEIEGQSYASYDNSFRLGKYIFYLRDMYLDRFHDDNPNLKFGGYERYNYEPGVQFKPRPSHAQKDKGFYSISKEEREIYFKNLYQLKDGEKYKNKSGTHCEYTGRSSYVEAVKALADEFMTYNHDVQPVYFKLEIENQAGQSIILYHSVPVVTTSESFIPPAVNLPKTIMYDTNGNKVEGWSNSTNLKLNNNTIFTSEADKEEDVFKMITFYENRPSFLTDEAWEKLKVGQGATSISQIKKISANGGYSYQLHTPDKFTNNKDRVFDVVQVNDGSNNFYYTIIYYLNRYGNETINGWDGQKLVIKDGSDGEEAVILAPLIGAGRKNPYNQFSGVVMGVDPQQDLTGLYGYQNGERTFGLTEDGNAYFKGDIVARSLRLGENADLDNKIAKSEDVKNQIQVTTTDIDNKYLRLDYTYKDYNKTPGNSVTQNSIIKSFYVSKEGLLTANNAIIYGTVYASAGEIGNWSINNVLNGGFFSNSTGVMLNGDSNYNKYAIIAGCGNNKSGNPDYDNAKFRVTHSGSLHATGVDIQGTIRASTLYLDAGAADSAGLATKSFVQNEVSGLDLSNYLTTSEAENGFVKVSYPGGTTFRVTTQNLLQADNIIVKGTVYARSGEIGPWELGYTNVKLTGSKNQTITVYDVGCLQTKIEDIIPQGTDASNSSGYDFLFQLRAPTQHIFNATGNSIMALSVYNNSSWQGNNFRIRADGRVETTELFLLNLDPVEYKNRVQAGISVDNKNLHMGLYDTGYYGSSLEISGYNDRSSTGHLGGTWSVENGTGTWSDVNVKNTISSLSSDYSNLFDNLHPVTYKYNNGTSDRLHTGFIAQEVKDALDKANIDSKDFAGLVILNRNTEEELWTLRYEEFIALNTHEIQKAKARISELETRVSQLESLLQANLD